MCFSLAAELNVHRISPFLRRELQRQRQVDGASGVSEGLRPQRAHDKLRHLELMVEQLLATQGLDNPQETAEVLSTSVPEQAAHHQPPGEPHTEGAGKVAFPHADTSIRQTTGFSVDMRSHVTKCIS